MSDYHEPWDALPEAARNAHRALTSFKEEIEAVDWYHQRAALCRDMLLRGVLEHNRDDEIEHACMALEWIRRNMSGWDDNLRKYLFTEGPITKPEEKRETDGKPLTPRLR
jgi:ferritin-like protein